jgi:hypothetical protein
MSGVQIGVSRLYRERTSQGKKPGMGNNIFLKAQTVVTDWCNSSKNILITSLFYAFTQSLYLSQGVAAYHVES